MALCKFLHLVDYEVNFSYIAIVAECGEEILKTELDYTPGVWCGVARRLLPHPLHVS